MSLHNTHDNRYAFGGNPFWVKLYLAQEDGIQNPLTDLIAEVYNFSQKPELDGKTVCGNCKKGQKIGIKSTAYVPITPILYKLLQAGRKLKSLTRDEVLAYLQKRAYWRVVKVSLSPPFPCRYDRKTPYLTAHRMAKSFLAMRSKNSTWKSSVAATIPSSSRIQHYPRHLRISRRNPPSPVVPTVHWTRSSNSPRSSHLRRGMYPLLRLGGENKLI